MESKKYINFLILIIIAAGIFYFISAKKIQAPTVEVGGTNIAIATSTDKTTPVVNDMKSAPAKSQPVITKNGTYIVSYESSGFKPDTIEIKRGTPVRFVNNSTKSLRVASTDTTNNPIFQAFSQPKTMGKGGIFEYTFNDVGTYYYTNQFNSAAKGTVVVK